jgi:heat shock protein HslJ
MTEMACMPEETMLAEQLYGSALTKVETVTLDGTLTLTGPGIELVFEALEPVPDAELTNTVWVLDGLIQDDAVSSPVADSRATVEFFTDGSMLGDTGCRAFSGRYQVNGAEVVVTELAADGHECEPGMSEQDNHVISSLEGSFRADIEGGRLTTWAQGDEGLTFVAES